MKTTMLLITATCLFVAPGLAADTRPTPLTSADSVERGRFPDFRLAETSQAVSTWLSRLSAVRLAQTSAPASEQAPSGPAAAQPKQAESSQSVNTVPKLFPIRNARAEELVPLLTSVIRPGRLIAVADPRSNSVILSGEDDSVIRMAESLLASLDEAASKSAAPTETPRHARLPSPSPIRAHQRQRSLAQLRGPRSGRSEGCPGTATAPEREPPGGKAPQRRTTQKIAVGKGSAVIRRATDPAQGGTRCPADQNLCGQTLARTPRSGRPRNRPAARRGSPQSRIELGNRWGR